MQASFDEHSHHQHNNIRDNICSNHHHDEYLSIAIVINKLARYWMLDKSGCMKQYDKLQASGTAFAVIQEIM